MQSILGKSNFPRLKSCFGWLPKLNFVSAETKTENERNLQFRQNRISAKMAEIRPKAETESVSVVHYIRVLYLMKSTKKRTSSTFLWLLALDLYYFFQLKATQFIAKELSTSSSYLVRTYLPRYSKKISTLSFT